MADKAGRGLVLYGDGLARFIDPSLSYTHLHSLSATASCGFLSLPTHPPSETEEERIVREFAVLLDACDSSLLHLSGEGTGQGSKIQTLSERFMGMRVALITNNSSLRSFGGKLGLTVLQVNESSVKTVASKLLKLLGFEQGKTLDMSEYDLVFVHVGAGEKDEKDVTSANDVAYINTLVGEIMGIAQPGSEIGSRLHLSLVMSYGSVLESDDTKFSVLASTDERNSNLQAIFPRQSYTMKGETPRNNVMHYCPMLIAQWQYAVTRKDATQKLSFEDFKQHTLMEVR